MSTMRQTSFIARNFLFALYLILIHALAALFVYERWISPYFSQSEFQAEQVTDPTEITEVPTPQPIPSIAAPTPLITEANTSQPENGAPSDSTNQLMIPVVGIKPEQLQDTFNDSRSQGRVHNAIDIIAPLGTPVVAVSDGEIAKFFYSERGGITIYQYSTDKKHVYYYAHLQKRADNIKETDFVKQGTIIGYVGDSGNSGAGNYHLHFAVTLLDDPKRIFTGTDLNPYPLLINGIEAQ